jgi:hypothetical protein
VGSYSAQAARAAIIGVWKGEIAEGAACQCSNLIQWWKNGATKDIMWRHLSLLDKIMWERGMTTIPENRFRMFVQEGLSPFDIAKRIGPRILVGEDAVMPSLTALCNNLKSGPTSATRWLAEKAACAAVRAATFEHSTTQTALDGLWKVIQSSIPIGIR